MSLQAEVVVEATAHGTWCWRYREPPPRAGGPPVQLAGHTDYETLDAAVQAARRAYPDAAVRVPEEVQQPSPPARRRRRTLVVLLSATALTVVVVRRSRHRPAARRRTRRS